MNARVAVQAESLHCPICDREFSKPGKAKLLLDMPVCKKCRNAFANRRQLAYIIDAILLSSVPVFCIGMIATMFFGYAPANPGTLLSFLGLSDPFEATLTWGLALLFICKDGFQGKSLGKLITGVRVIDINTREPIGFGRSFKRNLVLLIPFAALAVVFTMMKGRRWGDSWANTAVIWCKHAHRPPFDPRGILCVKCGYDLHGNVSGRCPECFTPIPDAQPTCPQCLSALDDPEAAFCTACGHSIAPGPPPGRHEAGADA